MTGRSTGKKIMVNLMKLGFLITIYTVSDIIAWRQFMSFASSHQIAVQAMQGLYDTLWFLELDSLMLVGVLWTKSIAVPSLMYLYNYLSIESLLYYIFQGKLPPYSMPWLNIGTSTNLYIMSAIFATVSILLIWGEAEATDLLKRVMYQKKVPNEINYRRKNKIPSQNQR